MPRPLPEALYHTAARLRRRWFERHPDARRRLGHPVVSVGNLTFGGSGKTPIVAALAGMLRDRGERPAVLSRGYARARREDGVVLVSDGDRVLADADRAGDEPLMLARSLPGVIVAVAADRYLAGRLAELHCGATVHLLDDGFQHVALARDVDLLVMDGRERAGVALREDPRAALRCDAVLLARGAAADDLPPKPTFRWWRELHDPVDLNAPGDRGASRATLPQLGPVVAVAGIASPDRFFEDLRRVGADVRATLAFRDHHRFMPRDLDAIVRKARDKGCASVVTTMKDAVRLRRFRPLPVATYGVPLTIAFDPAERLEPWLADHIAFARAQRRAA